MARPCLTVSCCTSFSSLARASLIFIPLNPAWISSIYIYISRYFYI